jgi:recombination associated protein RdgC
MSQLFKNAFILKAVKPPQTKYEIESYLQAHPFVPCGPTQEKSMGFVPPRGEENGALIESVGYHHIMKLMTETKSVPSAMVRKHAQAAADAIEAETGRKPGKKEMRGLKDDALLALLPQAFPKQSATWVWVDAKENLMVIDASSQSRADDAIAALLETLPGLQLSYVVTKTVPANAMTEWLCAESPDDWPGGFSVERECELVSRDEEKSVVKFNRHNLDNEGVRSHIKQGKVPTRLAMGFDGRVSFVLTEGFQLKKIAFLDGVFQDIPDEDKGGFDADVAICTGEMSRLLPSLIEALGGEIERGDA